MATHKPAVIISGTAQDLPGGDGLKDIASIENGLVLNEAGGDFDFRVEGDTATQLLTVDASADLVGIGTTVQGSLLEVSAANGVRVNRDQANVDFSIGGNGFGLFHCDASTGTVSILGGDFAAIGVVDTIPQTVFNNVGQNIDFRVESENYGFALWVDADEDTTRVGGVADFKFGTHVSLYAPLVVVNEHGDDADFRVEGDTLTHAVFVDGSAATENIALLAASAPNWQSMDRGLFIGNASTAPTGNPIDGVFFYSESGTLKYRKPDGSVISFASAPGDVIGPASSNDHSIARFDGTTGKLLQDSLVNISDAGAITGIVSLEGAAGGLVVNDAGADVDFRVEGDSLSHMLFVDASAATENIALVAGSAPNWQSMDGGLFIGNASTAPTGNPSSGVFLWSEAGELRARDGGGTVTTLTNPLAGMSITGTKSANYTAANGEHVICDTDAAAGNFTVTLPASPSAGDAVRVSIIKDHATRVVDVGRNGSNVQGGTAVDHLRLCLEGDTVLFTYVGSDCGWEVESSLRPHLAEMVRAAAQTINYDTRVGSEINFDTATFDQGAIVDLTNNWFLIRRSGLYTITGFWGVSGLASDAERIITWVRKYSTATGSDSDLRLVNFVLSPAANQSLVSVVSQPLLLNAGDKIDMVVEQTLNSPNISTSTLVVFRPTLNVAEMR